MSKHKTLRVACVGTGYFSQFHYEAWHRLPNVELVGVCDLNMEQAKEFAQRYGIPKVFDDVSVMAEEVSADVVDVITPPFTHMDVVTQCLKAKFDVICQKPFCENFKQAKEMVDLAEECDQQLIVHENFRFMPWYRAIKTLLDKELIGQIFNIQYRLRPGDGQGKDAYLARQPYFQTMPRFMIHETGIHFIDVFRYLVGEFGEVSARLRKCNPIITGEDSGVVSIGFKNGAQGIIDGNRCVDHAADNMRRTMGEMLIEGSQGCIRLDGAGKIWLRKMGKQKETEHEYHWNDYGFGGDCVFNCIQHIAEHYLRGTKLENVAAEYLKNIQIEEAVYQSHEQRRTLDV